MTSIHDFSLFQVCTFNRSYFHLCALLIIIQFILIASSCTSNYNEKDRFSPKKQKKKGLYFHDLYTFMSSPSCFLFVSKLDRKYHILGIAAKYLRERERERERERPYFYGHKLCFLRKPHVFAKLWTPPTCSV